MGLGTQAESITLQIQTLAQTRLADCYQCGKCTAGCPRSQRMDAPPTRLMRWLQLGEVSRALAASSIWDCVSCQTCTARCPQGVDCAAVLDALRELALARHTVAPGRARVVAFQQAFLDNIRHNGRLNEIELTAAFKLRAFRQDGRVGLLMQDAGLAPELMRRGKLHLKGERVADRAVVARIFERCHAAGGAK